MTTSSAGISLGLITAELVINALKHAFPKGKKGKIVVAYHAPKQGEWQLSISDNGIGINPILSRREGLGTTIVQSLANQLDAGVQIQTGPQGTTVSIGHPPQHSASPLPLS